MPDTQFTSTQKLRNLATALRNTHGTLGDSKLPAPTDQDILRAMLGKPFGPAKVESTQSPPIRKAG